MNGPKPKRYPWSWALLPQEGRFHVMILTVGLGDKTFLAYSGVEEGNLSHSELTHAAMWKMRGLSSSWFLDTRKSVKPSVRVYSAFLGAADDSAVLFLSPDDRRRSEVMKTILRGKRMEPIA
jgi:hypothetical protein